MTLDVTPLWRHHGVMDLNQYVEALRGALSAAGRAASDDVREAADRLSYAVEPSLRLTLLEALGEAAAEVTTQLDGVVVDVRLRGGTPELVATDDRSVAPLGPPAPPAPPRPPSPPTEGDEGTSRVSLRLPESLKNRVEAEAAAAGASVNAWLIRAITQTLDGPEPSSSMPFGPGRRISGWVR